MALWRIATPTGPRWATGPADTGPEQFLAPDFTLDTVLAASEELAAAARPDGPPVPDGAAVLAPLESQEVWAAGVTYERSRAARREESGEPDLYDQVYVADRPELFFKATAARVRGPGAAVAIRADSGWDVPEPELGVVATAHGRVAGYVLGNDVSSRAIEGVNALYLPQAKVYEGSCALGPCLVPIGEAPAVVTLDLLIRRDGAKVAAGRTTTASLRRTPEDLLAWLFRALTFPVGVVLLTGTGVVPDPGFTLAEGDEVTIAGTGLGRLTNHVEVVGRG
jgi:2-dehydro-3-deoxy-D-arabinonate dehydratase